MVDIIVTYISLALILLIAIWLHEYAHAYVSYKLWDPTPKLQWRLTTNPLKHIDIVWFLMIFLIGFWWWKPVQVNPSYYKDPVKWELLVALAGPATNLVLAIIGIILLLLLSKISWGGINDIYLWNLNYVTYFFYQFSMINICLAVFNMIPLPPLDGFRLVKIVSLKFANMIEQYTRYIVIAFLILVILWQNVIWWFLSSVSWSIFEFLFTLFASIFY